MRSVSPKRAGRQRERKKLEERAVPEACGRCHEEPAVEHHELVRRSQGDTAADVFLMVPLGRRCHDWVGEHPTQAHDEGWALWGWELDDPEAHRRAWLSRLGFR